MSTTARALTLVLDASASLGTVAVLDGATVLAEGETRMRGESGERLLPAALSALETAHATLVDVAEVVCGDGPGGFTGLRIAAGVAKGLCVARAVPLFAVSSLMLGIAGVRPFPPPGRYLVALDAMREEVFVLAVTVNADGTVVAGREQRMPVADALALVAREGLALAGGASLIVQPHARGLAALRERAPAQVRPVALDSWEPAYGRKAEAQVKWEAAHGRALA